MHTAARNHIQGCTSKRCSVVLWYAWQCLLQCHGTKKACGAPCLQNTSTFTPVRPHTCSTTYTHTMLCSAVLRCALLCNAYGSAVVHTNRVAPMFCKNQSCLRAHTHATALKHIPGCAKLSDVIVMAMGAVATVARTQRAVRAVPIHT